MNAFSPAWWLFVIVTVCGFIALAWVARARVRTRWRLLMGSQIKISEKFTFSKIFLLVLSLLCLILALGDIRWGSKPHQKIEKSGYLVVALDLSASMQAQDAPPSRLETAKRKIADLLARMQGERVALVGFAGEARRFCPFTSDYEAISMFVESASVDDLQEQGTNLSNLVAVVEELFNKAAPENPNRGLVIITDGEDLEGSDAKVFTKFSEMGIAVSVLGVGTADGAPIPIDGGGFKEDSSGNTILSKADPGFWEKLASAANGRSRASTIDDSDWAYLYDEFIAAKIGTSKSSSTTPQVQLASRVSRAWIFVILTLLGLVGQFLLAPRWVIFLLLVNFYLPQKDSLFAQSSDNKKSFGEGVDAYKKGEYGESSKKFSQGASDESQDVAKRSLFNLGNAEAQNGNYEGAIAAYEDALNLDPQYQAAKDNLEFVKKLKEEKDKQKDQQKSDEKDPNKKNEDSDSDDKNKEKNDQKNENNKDQNQKDAENKDQAEKKPTPGQEDQPPKMATEEDIRKQQLEQALDAAQDRASQKNDKRKSKARASTKERDW